LITNSGNKKGKTKYSFVKNFFVTVVFLLFSMFICAQQNKTDSLLLLFQSAKDNRKVDLLNELSISSRNISLNKSLDYANQAIDLALKMNYKFGEADGYKNKGVVYFIQNKNTEALAEYEKSLHLFKQEKNSAKVSALMNNIANIYVRQGDYEKALTNYLEAAKINIETNKQESVANIYNNIGMVYNKWGKNEQAYEYYNKSLDINKKLNNKLGIAAALNNIALILKNWGQFEKSLGYFQEAVKTNEEIGDKIGIARCLSNMALVYLSLGQDKKALELNLQSLELKMELEDNQGVLFSYSGIGDIYYNTGEFEKALEFYEKSLNTAIQSNSKEYIILSNTDIGDTYFMVKNYLKALEYYGDAIHIAEKIKSNQNISVIRNKIGNCQFAINQYNSAGQNYLYSLNLARELNLVSLIEQNAYDLSVLYAKTKNFEKAYQYQTEYIEIHTKLFNENTQTKISEIQTKYETEKKEKEIIELKSKQVKVKQQNLYYYTGSILVIFIIIIIFLQNRYLIKKKSLNMLDQKNILLEKANQDLILAKEKAQESDRLKTAFLTNISHEIRTPMNAIIGFSEYITDNDIAEDEKKELFNLIRINSNVLLSLIDDILDVSLIETGQLKIKNEKVSLEKLMEESYLLVKENKKLKQSRIDFTYYIDNQLKGACVISDPFRLKQILVNLLDNSIKFTDSGQISFSCKLIDNESGKIIQFSIDDTGIGIDKKYHEMIFERFFKVPSNNTVIYRGSGIGLSIAKSLINQMKGQVWLRSEPNVGTSFIFTIPYIESSQANEVLN